MSSKTRQAVEQKFSASSFGDFRDKRFSNANDQHRGEMSALIKRQQGSNSYWNAGKN